MLRARVLSGPVYGTHGTNVVLYGTVQCMLQVQTAGRAHGRGGSVVERFTSWVMAGTSARTRGSLGEKGRREGGAGGWSNDVLEAVVRASLHFALPSYHMRSTIGTVHPVDYLLPPPLHPSLSAIPPLHSTPPLHSSATVAPPQAYKYSPSLSQKPPHPN